MTSIVRPNRQLRRRPHRAESKALTKGDLELRNGTPEENLLHHLRQTTITLRKRLSTQEAALSLDEKKEFLAHFNQACEKYIRIRGKWPSKVDFGDVLWLLRAPLLSREKEIRASAVRLVRYFLNTPDDVSVFIERGMAALIVRILDNNNDDPAYEDRVQALKLIRKLLKIVPKHLPRALVITLVTIINNSLRNDTHDNAEKRTLPVRDKLYRPCIEILCEISFAAPGSVIEVGGFRVLLDAVLDKTITGTSPNISESMVITILHLIQFMPNVSADYHLSYLISPHFEKGKHADSGIIQAPTCSGVQYNASRLALTSLLRNWRGLANLCHGKFNNSISELLAIFCCNLDDTILLDSLLTLLFDVFNIRSCQEQELEEIEEKSHECSTIFDDLVAASQKLDYDDEQEFSLAQNFFIAESRYKESIYETDGAYFDLSQSYKILILAIFLEARLVEHLIELITNAASEVVAAKGGLLLAEIDVLTSLYLPAHCVSNSVLSEKLPDKTMLVLATSEIITSRLTHIVNDESFPGRARRRAHQAIMWLKNYRRLRKASFQQSIFLQHQIKLRTHKPKPILSVPLPAPTPPSSSHTSSRRSSLGIFNITKSKTTANIFDNNATARKSFGKRSWMKLTKKAASVGSTPKSPTKTLERQPSEDSENVFLNSLEDLQLSSCEYTPDWLVLSRKLKEFMDEKISEIFPHGDDTLETNNGIKVQDIVESIRGHLLNPHWADENVEWGPLWAEKEEVEKKIECAECFITFLGTLCLYFQARRTSCSRLFEWAIEIIEEILNHYYERLVEMTHESPFILRQQLTSQNCLFIRYTPLLYSYLVCDSNIMAIGAIRPGMKRMIETIKFQLSDLGKCFKRRNSSSSSDSVMLDDDNCPLEKLLLSSFDFSEVHCRSLFEDIAEAASDHLKNFLSELVLFWVEAKAEWIVRDKWLYLQTLSLVRQSPKQSDTALVAFQQFVRIPKIANYALQELGMIMEFDLCLRQKILCVLVENEFIAQKVEEFGAETDLDFMLDSWMTTGQYEFSKEIEGRLKVSFSTSDVKDYERESVPRRSVLSRNVVRPVHLPHNLLHSLASHAFGVERLRDYVRELVIQLNQPVARDLLPDCELDRHSALWSAGAILSTNFGCNVFSSQLWPLVIKNLKHEWLPIRATAFYVVNWISRSPYGADLIEYETNLSWKVKKRLVGDVGRRQRNSTVDSWSSNTFPDDSFKDLYIDSSNPSLNDPFQSTDGINRSNEHLVHSISRLLDQNRPLIVSISRQWSQNEEQKTPLYREQRSISDTTAMELTVSRHQSFDSSSPMSPMKNRLRTRTHRVMSSASSNAEMPSVPEGRPLEEPLVSQSLNETKLRQNMPFFNRFATDAETFAVTNGHIRPTFASEMRKSRTEPSLGSFATYQSSEAGCSGSADPGNDTSDFDNEIYQITPPEYPGIALPNDLMSFLNIPQMNSELDLPLPNGIETQQQNAAQNTLEGDDESLEIFSEVLQLVRDASRGKGEIPKKIFHLRTKHVEAFRNLKLYERVINRLVETSAVGVTNFRKHVHELFDWRSVDQTSTKNLFFHEIEEQMSEIDKKWTASYPALLS